MKRKLLKFGGTFMALAMSVVLLASCGSSSDTTDAPTDAPTNAPTDAPTDAPGTDEGGAINVWTRDSASGTRGAFEEIVGFEGELTNDATETSGNGDMASKVGNDQYGIGYVSLTTDFEANNLKKVNLNGVEPTEENTLSGDYEVSRPFNFVTRAEDDFSSDEIKDLTAAFVDFLTNSVEGLEAVYMAGGIVNPDEGTSWDELKANHPIVDQDNSHLTLRTSGSTSVEATIQAALETFQPLAGNFEFAMNHTGSGDGFAGVMGDKKDDTGGAEVGFASRGFKTDGSEEVGGAMASGTYCMDAVVVVVSNDNPVTDLTLDDVAAIFKGEITDWSDVG